MSHKPGTPLPATLDGVIVERPIKIDRALLYLVGGALSWLTDNEPLEQTGTLTVEGVRDALSAMLWDFYHEVLPVDNTPIGTILMWPSLTPPDGWLLCAAGVYNRVDYPDLYAVLDSVFHVDADNFTLPDLNDRFPYGASSGGAAVGDSGGQSQVVLTVGQLPNHTHDQRASNGATLLIANGATSSNVGILPVAVTRNAADPQPVVTGQTGSGGAHNNMPPWRAVAFIIRAL